MGDRCSPTAQAGAISQASRAAFDTARLCNSSINQGLSLKEIGDHLGQRDFDVTRIYAKVDLVRLREVATFDLGELL
jgi:integrase/recombinase XerD